MKRLFSARALPAIVLSVAMCVRAQTQTNDAASAAEPLWWSGIWAAGRVNADNDAPINVGQLKHVASRALAWLNTISISQTTQPAAHAARESFRGMVAGWTPGPAAENAAPVPVGALKETAAKFHDVLAALGYPLVTGEMVGDVLEAEEGLTNPPRYPWGAAGTLEELQAPANVGQLKTAFRAPHPGLVEGTVGLHGALTLADDGQMADGVSSARAIAAVTLPVWGAPRMGAAAYAANGSTAGPMMPSAVRLARPTLLRFSPWLSEVKFQGVVHFTAVEHRIGDVTTWIPVVSGGVLAENVSLPYSPGLSADFKGGTYVEFAQVATRRDRPDAEGSVDVTIRSAYPLVRRGTLAADAPLRYNNQASLACTFAGGSEVMFSQFPRLVERARWGGSRSVTRFDAVGQVVEGRVSPVLPPQTVNASPGVTVTLQPGSAARFGGFLTRQVTASGTVPAVAAPTDLFTAGSGTDIPVHAGGLPLGWGHDPYGEWEGSSSGRVYFRPLSEPRSGVFRPEDPGLVYLTIDATSWYREREEAVGWLSRGVPALDAELPAGVLGVGMVKCAALHPVAFRHFVHEFTSPPRGGGSTLLNVPPPEPLTATPTAAGWRLNERVHGYVAEAVTAGPGDVVMPGTNGLSITVPEDRAVAFDHDAMSLASGAAQPSPWWLPVVRGRLIPESVSPVASNPQAADADGDGFTAGEEMRMGSSDGDAAVPGGVRPFLASALAGLGPHVIHDERDAPRPVGNGAWGHQTVVSIPVTAEATKRYLSLVVTHRGFPRGTRSAVGDTLTWSLTGGGAALGGTVKASDLHHIWLSSMAGGRTLGGARPFWVIPLGFVADGGATAGVTVTTASARGEWVVAAVLTDDSQALAGVGGRFVAVGAGVPENHVRINDRPAAVPFAERPQLSGGSTASGSGDGFDSDGDFSPDLEEQAAGTNPGDKSSAPVVLSSLIIARHSTRLRPNPPGGRGSTALSINNGWEVDSQFRYLMRAWVVPPGYVNLLGGEQFEKSDARFSGDTGEHGGDFADLWDHHAAPLASRGLPSAELGGLAPVALFIGREGRASADGPFWHEEIFTRGMRYHLRGPARLESQERTYIRARWVKEWPSVEAYYRDLMEIGTTWLYFDKTPSGAPTSTSIVKLEIPPSQLVGGGAHYSNSHDVVPELRSIPEKTKGVVLVTERLLPVELDIVHPATGELDEGKQHDARKGGYIAVRRDDKSPVTKLVLRQCSGVSGIKFKVKFDGSDKFKLWKDAARIHAVVSQQTEFDPAQETTLYFEGLKKSTSVGAESLTIQAVINGTSTDAETIYANVVEAEFDVWLNMFIPPQWVDLPALHPIHNEFDGIDPVTGAPRYVYRRRISGGDDRSFSTKYFTNPALDVDDKIGNTSTRAHSQVVIIPFKDLDADGFKDNSAKSVMGLSHNYLKSASVPDPSAGYSSCNRLVPQPTVTGTDRALTSDMQIDGATRYGTDGNTVKFRFHGSAGNPVVIPSPTIDWDFEIAVSVSDSNTLSPKWELIGHKQDGFPAYEIYVRDSDGTGGNNQGTPVYTFDPIQHGNTPLDLTAVYGDVTVTSATGTIP